MCGFLVAYVSCFAWLFLEGVMEKLGKVMEKSFFSSTFSSDIALHFGSKTKSD